MSDKRINQLTDEITSPHANDLLAVDFGSGSTSANRTFRLKWSNLLARIADAVMTMTNKTLTNPTITGGMTVNFTGTVANLNADRVRGLNPGDERSDLASWGEDGDQGCLDVGFQGHLESEYLRADRGLAGQTTTLTAGTHTLNNSQAGQIRLDLSSGSVNITLPQATSANAGAQFLFTVVTASGTNNTNINRAGSDKMVLLKDDLGKTEFTTVKLTAQKDTVVLKSNGNGYWMITGGVGLQ